MAPKRKREDEKKDENKHIRKVVAHTVKKRLPVQVAHELALMLGSSKKQDVRNLRRAQIIEARRDAKKYADLASKTGRKSFPQSQYFKRLQHSEEAKIRQYEKELEEEEHTEYSGPPGKYFWDDDLPPGPPPPPPPAPSSGKSGFGGLSARTRAVFSR